MNTEQKTFKRVVKHRRLRSIKRAHTDQRMHAFLNKQAISMQLNIKDPTATKMPKVMKKLTKKGVEEIALKGT